MSNELYHYGVPGMKWGVRRKARRDAYKQIRKSERERPLYERIVERKVYGRRGVRRMRKDAASYMADGMPQEKALKRAKDEAVKRKTVRAVTRGAAIAAIVLDVKFNDARASKWAMRSAGNLFRASLMNTPYSQLL